MTIDTSSTATLADLARAAFNDQVTVKSADLARERAAELQRIHEGLAVLGFEAAGEAYINPASGRPCVPLIVGGVTTETDDDGEEYLVFTHTVAAEWDDDIDDPGLVLVADQEPEGRLTDAWLYPAGRLRTLADIGVALEHGGQVRTEPSGIWGDIRRSIDAAHGAAANATGYEAIVMAHAANAICIALLDVAAAIRETGRG